MGELERMTRIDGAALDQGEYVSALIEAGVGAERLSARDLERIQLECLDLLAQRTARYTGGESSSVRLETAQALMASNLFTVGVQLKTCARADDAVEVLRVTPLAELYALGRKQIDVKRKAARARYGKLLRDLVPIPNEIYLGTIKGGIQGFFKRYDPDFFAQEIHITADYPLSRPVVRLAGIEFIQAYLDGLVCENTFLSRFDADAIHRMLLGYSADYGLLIFNLFEQTLASAVGCVLTGADPTRLSVPGGAGRQLQAALLCKSREELGELVAAAAQTLEGALNLPGSVKRYLALALPSLTANLAFAVEHLCLERLFPAAK